MTRFRYFSYIAAATLFTPLLIHAATDKTFQRTLHVSGTPAVVVHTGSGDIHVSQGAVNQVAILGKIHSSNWGWGSPDEKTIDQIVQNPPIQQTGNIIQIGGQNDGSSSRGSIFGGHSISIDYEITVPKGTDLKVHTGSGNLRMEAVSGPLQAGTGSGDITASDMVTDSKLETGSGSIHANNASGTLKLNTGSGDIELKDSSISDLNAQTGSGSMQLDGVQGHLRAGTGSGDITVKGTPSADWYLETGSGNIDLTIPSSSKITLDAKGGSGSIHSDLPLTMQGELNKHHVEGTLNGGGSMIRAASGSGDIRIH
ncbi:MAG TPA: DUF4097 family beta strand repeat-containing protein [Acidobacteriaceae bacterium]|nr:DUF4097 family beta strand repeat-containing protein [Acidobacteriaceae bacterium]